MMGAPDQSALDLQDAGAIVFDAASLALRGRKSRRLGAILLTEQPVPVAPGEDSARLLAESIARLGIDRLPWTKPLVQWRDRVMFLRASEGADWPDLSDPALAASASAWLMPALAGKTALAELSADEFGAALGELLVKSGAGGAAAVWGPAGLSSNGDAKLLAERFYHATDARLGDRVLRAIGELRTLGGDPDLPRVYDLMGDPALRLQAPLPPAVTGTGTGE